MTKRALPALSASAAFLLTGCLYIPPLHHTAGVKTVQRIEAGTATRDEVRTELGKPNVLGKRDVYVYDWDQSYGFLFVGGGYTGGGGEITGKHLHAVVFFENDRVARYEWDSSPAAKPQYAKPPFVPAPVTVPLLVGLPEPSEPAATCAAYSVDLARCLVATDATGGAWVDALGSERGRLVLPWKTKAGSPPWSRSMISPDDRVLVVGRRDRSLEWAGWWLEDGRPFPLVANGKEVSPLAFSADGAQLVAERRGGEIVLLDARDGRLLLTARPLKGRLQSASFAPGRIAVSTNRGDVALLDHASGAVTTRLRSRRTMLDGRTVALSPDGRVLASTTSTALELWDVAALEEEQRARATPLETADDGPTRALRYVAMFPAADAGAAAVAFSPDGTLVAAGAGRHVLLARTSGGPLGWLEVSSEAKMPANVWLAMAEAMRNRSATKVARVGFSADGTKVFVLFGAESLAFESGVP